MQDCFRQHPEIYGAELDDDEQSPDAAAPEQPHSATELEASSSPDEKRAHAKEVRDRMKSEAAEKGEHSESESLVPKAAHDTQEETRQARA